MDHTAWFAVDSLHKQYPEPDQLPEEAYLVVVRDGGVFFRAGSAPTIFEQVSPALLEGQKKHAQYLGHLESVPCYAIEVPGDLPPPGGWTYSGVRELAGLIPAEEVAIAGLAIQVTDYDRATRFCGWCGTATEPVRTERAKVCPSCQRVTYPRISPAVIVLVRTDTSVLMVRGKKAPPGRYSLVAGFVEPGETVEHAVYREVREEAGITIKNIRYWGSEPWPFPNSLMLGFVADYEGGALAPDGIEIESAGWFDRDHLPDLPKNLSITRALIDNWLSGT
jgi:NAD+ diphosphatase